MNIPRLVLHSILAVIPAYAQQLGVRQIITRAVEVIRLR